MGFCAAKRLVVPRNGCVRDAWSGRTAQGDIAAWRMAASAVAPHRFLGHGTRRRRLASCSMQRIACPERDDWRTTADAPGSIFTPSTASAIGTNAPITPSRSTKSNGRSKRRPARSMRCASNWSAASIGDERYLRRLKIPETVLAADLRELAPRRSQPLWPARSRVSTAGAPRNCSNTTPIRRPRFSRRRCFNGPGSNRRSSGSIIPKRADQFNSIHERLIEAWKKFGAATLLHLDGTTEKRRGSRHAGTISRTPRSQAGLGRPR